MSNFSEKISHMNEMLERIYSIQQKGVNKFMFNVEFSDCIIPEGINIINNSLFEGCTWLISIQLPSTLTTIGEFAFSNTRISSITISERVTSIGKNAFYGTNVVDVQVKEGIKTFKIQVPEFIKKILELKGIECPNSYHDEEDSRREMIEQFKMNKEVWEITIYEMMIIGKYFETNNDFINVMKVSKKYN